MAARTASGEPAQTILPSVRPNKTVVHLPEKAKFTPQLVPSTNPDVTARSTTTGKAGQSTTDPSSGKSSPASSSPLKRDSVLCQTPSSPSEDVNSPCKTDLRHNNSRLTPTQAPVTMTMTDTTCANGVTKTRISTYGKKEAQLEVERQLQEIAQRYAVSKRTQKERLERQQKQQQHLQRQQQQQQNEDYLQHPNKPPSHEGGLKNAGRPLTDKDGTVEKHNTTTRSSFTPDSATNAVSVDGEIQQQRQQPQLLPQQQRTRQQQEQSVSVGRQENAHRYQTDTEMPTSKDCTSVTPSSASEESARDVDVETQQLHEQRERRERCFQSSNTRASKEAGTENEACRIPTKKEMPSTKSSGITKASFSPKVNMVQNTPKVTQNAF